MKRVDHTKKDVAAKKNAGRVMVSRLERKYGPSRMHIIYDDKNDGYNCHVAEELKEQNLGRHSREVADDAAKRLGLLFYPIDMSYPSEDRYSQVLWLWGKYAEFKTLDDVEGWVMRFMTSDVNRVEELYRRNMDVVRQVSSGSRTSKTWGRIV